MSFHLPHLKNRARGLGMVSVLVVYEALAFNLIPMRLLLDHDAGLIAKDQPGSLSSARLHLI